MKRYSNLIETEIYDYIKTHKWATLRKLMSFFNSELFDPPNIINVKKTLTRMYIKDKLERARLRVGKASRAFIYFLPDDMPEFLR